MDINVLSRRELINLMRQHHFRPYKRWGQNFLINRNIRDRIIEAFSLRKTDTVFEVGPGFGALTGELSRKTERVIAVERDERLCAILRKLLVNCGNVEIVSADILKFDFTKLSINLHPALSTSGATESRKRGVKIVGNLPYYITSPIIIHLLKMRTLVESIIITVQKEVAQRLLSGADEGSYGAISCFVQFYSKPSLVMKIKRNAFFPQPEVDSSLVKLKIRKIPKVQVKNEELFFKIIRASFNQRRKTLLNSLVSKLGLNRETLSRILESLKIDPRRRGETLSLEEFAKIANHISAIS